MPESVGDGPVRTRLLATREITANIRGVECDILVIPKADLVDVDYSQCPEDDPLRRQVNIEKMTGVGLDLERDLRLELESALEGRIYKLTKRGAYRLLESL